MSAETKPVDVVADIRRVLTYVNGYHWGRLWAGRPHVEMDAAEKAIGAVAELIKAVQKIVKDEEQAHFESWLGRYSPSGDAESVHGQWEESSDFRDFFEVWSDVIDALARVGGAK